MHSSVRPASVVIGVAITTLSGIAFFFAIIGVFGLDIAICALVIFIALSVSTSMSMRGDVATVPIPFRQNSPPKG